MDFSEHGLHDWFVGFLPSRECKKVMVLLQVQSDAIQSAHQDSHRQRLELFIDTLDEEERKVIALKSLKSLGSGD